MVGRPGRSKGCFNCRRRKKGCDLARPCCGQCTKSKLECAGYDDNLGVVLYTPLASRSQARLRGSAMEVKYIDTFWELLLPTMCRAPRTSNGDWIRVIRDRYTSDGPFKIAMRALTLSRVGQYIGNDNVARLGAILYNDCLREVARTINLRKGACNNEIIAVCLILSLYEILCNPLPQGPNWQSHIEGIGTLIQLRGSHAFASGISHDLYASARLDVIFAALVSRKSTFLDSNEWLTVPWSTDSTPKSLYDRIVDLCAQVPRILEMLDQMQISRPQPACDPEALLSACWRLDNELNQWFREFVAACILPHIDRAGSSYPIPDFEAPLTADTEIDHEYAQALSIYWMTCCLIYTTLRLVWQAADCPLYILPQRIDPLRYASLISKSLPYFTTPSAGERSLVYYSMSMGAALHCLSVVGQLGSPDAQRITGIFEHPEDPRGVGDRVGAFLKTLAAANVKCKINVDSVTHERMVELGRKWWGGGTEVVMLQPRAPSANPVKASDSRSGELLWATLF